MIHFTSTLRLTCLLTAVLAFMSGCSWKQPHSQPPAPEPENQAALIQNHEEEPEFILGEGDVVDISVYRNKTSENVLGIGDSFNLTVYRQNTSEFVLVPGDTLAISVYRHNELSSQVELDQNGKFVMPLIGEVNANGRTTAELREVISAMLDKYIVNPQVLVTIETKQSFLIDPLSLSFTISAPKGGRVLIPMIGEIKVAGMHVDELQKLLEERFSESILNPVVVITPSQLSNLQMDELTMPVTIQRNGKFTYPLLGDVQAAGLGIHQLQDELQKKLSEYIVSPTVVLNVSTVQSQQFYVLGEVNEPGIFTMDRRMGLLDAIGRAGGFTDDANENAVLLVRRTPKEVKAKALNMNLKKLGPQSYTGLLRGDLIYVPPKQIASVERFMVRLGNILSTIIRVEQAIVLGPEVEAVLKGGDTNTPDFVIND